MAGLGGTAESDMRLEVEIEMVRVEDTGIVDN